MTSRFQTRLTPLDGDDNDDDDDNDYDYSNEDVWNYM